MLANLVVLGDVERGAADLVGQAEASVGPILNFVCSNADLRRRLGLKGASRRADGWPAWYFWFAGMPGAHELALIPPADLDDGELAPQVAFAIRYFPHPEEEAFDGFASVERTVRLSNRFDATGTPAIELFDTIEPSLFHVATLKVSSVRGGLDQELVAQDCWRETETGDAGTRIRRTVRGFALGAPVLDLLVAAHVYYGRTPPDAVVVLCEPGICWYIDESGHATAEVAGDLSLLTVQVRGLARFGVEPSDALAVDDDIGRRSPAQRCIYSHRGRTAPPPFPGLDLAAWWRAATWRFVPSGLFCGCQAEDLSVAGRDEGDSCAATASSRPGVAR